MAPRKTKYTKYEMRIVKVGEVRENPLSDSPISSPEEVIRYLDAIRDQPQEHFVALTLDGGGNIITSRVITVGLLNHSLVHPRETFRGAILDNAASIIIAHNHPSGSLEPSSQDIAITRQIKEAGQIIGINLIDHIIVSKKGHVSLRERGLV